MSSSPTSPAALPPPSESSASAERAPTRPTAPKVILSLAAAVAMVIVACTWAVWVLLFQAPVSAVQSGVETVRVQTGKAVGDAYDFARRVAGDFAERFKVEPTVRVNTTTLIEGTRAISELATVERQIFVESETTNTWMGSTKQLKLRGTFLVKAGFDLRDSTAQFTIDETTGQIQVALPEAKILSMECTKVEFMEDTSGWWNSMTKAEREVSVNNLREEAHKRASSGNILQEARRNMEDQVKEIVLRNSHPMRFQYTVPGPALPPPERK